MKKIIGLVLTIVLISSFTYQQKTVWKYLIVKNKYVENTTTRDWVFGTGNWHSTDRYIVDRSGKIWKQFTKEDFIRVRINDTMWTDDGYTLKLNRKK
jgi:hypothetical protein